MRTCVRLAALAVFLWATFTYAAAPPKLTPGMRVPGVSPGVVSEIAHVSVNELRKATDALKSKVDLLKPTPSDAELQCVAFTFARTVAQAAELLEGLAAAKTGIPADPVRVSELQAAARYFASLEDQWCNGRGGKTSRVTKFVEAFRSANAPQARSTWDSIRDRLADLDRKPSWGPSEWALVGAACAVALALELVPIPI